MKNLLLVGALLAPVIVVHAADAAPSKKKARRPVATAPTAPPSAAAPVAPAKSQATPAAEATVLQPVFVTATRSAESENRLPAAITTLTREDIARSGARNVVDALRSSGVAQVTDLYGDGSRAQVDMRGFGDTFLSNTLILVDGRRLNNPDMAAPDLSSIALKDIERIEIIEGSGATLYGDQAVGGVINIITRAMDKTRASLEATVGSNDALGVRAQGGQRIGDFAYRLSAEERGGDNYRDHNHNESRNFFGYGEYRYGDRSRVFVEAGDANERLQTPGALTFAQVQQNRQQVQPGNGGDYADTHTQNFRIGLDQELFRRWNFSSEITHRNSDITGVLTGVALTQKREIQTLTPRFTGKIGLPTGDAQITVGFDAQKARYRLTAFGPTNNDQMQTDGYVQAIVPVWTSVDATLGGRVARVSNKGLGGAPAANFNFGDTQYASEAGLAWKPLKPLRVFARYEENFRFAKVDEFTATAAAPCKTSQPLCTQTGKSYELGSAWQAARWSAALSLYRLDLNNEIAFDPTLGFFGGNANLPPTRRDGQTLRLSWQALDALRLGASYQHVDARVESGALAGKNVPMVASQTGSLSADVDLPWWNLVLRSETFVTSARAFAGDFNNALGTLAGNTVTNLALSRNVGTWQFTARVNNVFDTDYSEYGAQGFPPPAFAPAQTFYPSPGINGLLTVRYVYE